MSVKYYAQFTLVNSTQEYGGTIELAAATNQYPHEIAKILANNFDLEDDDLELIDWHRIH